MSEDKEIKENGGGIVAQFKPKEDGINLQIPYLYPLNRDYGFARFIGMERIKGVTSTKILEGVNPINMSLATNTGGYYPCLLSIVEEVHAFEIEVKIKVDLSNGQSFDLYDPKLTKVVKAVRGGEEPNYEELGFPKPLTEEEKKAKKEAKEAFLLSSLSSLVDGAEEWDEDDKNEDEDWVG